MIDGLRDRFSLNEPVTGVRRSRTDVAEACYGDPATGVIRENSRSGVTKEVGVSHASTAPGSPPGARRPRPADSRRLSDRTCPKQHAERFYGRTLGGASESVGQTTKTVVTCKIKHFYNIFTPTA